MFQEWTFSAGRGGLSGREQVRHSVECRVLALLPITLQHLARPVVQVKPLAAGLEKRLAFCQLRLATLPVVMPGHGFRAQQQMQVVVPCQQCLLDPCRTSAKQGLAPEDVTQQVSVENQQMRLPGACLVLPSQLAMCY